MKAERNVGTLRRIKITSGMVVAALIAAVVLAAAPAGSQSIDDKRAEAARVAAELEQLDNRLMDLTARLEQSRHALEQAEDDVAAAQAKAAETQAELARRQDQLREFSVEAYIGGSEDAGVTALFTNEGDDTPQVKMYLESTTGNRKDLLDSLSATKKQAEDDTVRLEDARSAAARLSEDIESSHSEMGREVANQRAVSSRVQGELATLVQQEAARRAEAQRAAAATTTTQRQSSGGSSDPEPAEYSGPVREGLGGAIEAALSRQGSSYVWGAEGPNSFDCSGLMLWAFAQVGISLPHYSGAQYNMTRRVSRDDLQPGDLVFWGGGGSEHVALYIGGDQIVHAYGSGRGVGVTNLDGWWKTPAGYGRL